MSNQLLAPSLLIEAKQMLEGTGGKIAQVNAQTYYAENNQLSLQRKPRNLDKQEESRYETTIQILKKNDGSQSAVAPIELSVKVNAQGEIYQLRCVQKEGEKFIQKDIEIENNQIKKINILSDHTKEIFEYENDELKKYSSEEKESEMGYKKIVKLLETGKKQEGQVEHEKSIQPYHGKAHFSEIEGNLKYSAGLFLQNIKGESFFDYIMKKIEKVKDENKQEITINVLSDFVSIFKAVDDYHAQGYVHLDLKHDNFMTDGQEFIIIDHLSKTKIGEKQYPLTSDGFTHPERINLIGRKITLKPGVLAAKKHDHYSVGAMLEMCITQIGVEITNNENISLSQTLDLIAKNAAAKKEIKTLISDLKEKELDSLESSIEKINSIIQLINQPECEVNVEARKIVSLSKSDNPDQKIKDFLKQHLGEDEQFSMRLFSLEARCGESQDVELVRILKSSLLELSKCHANGLEVEMAKKDLKDIINKFGFVYKNWFNKDADSIFKSMEKANAPSHVESVGLFQCNANSMAQSDPINNLPLQLPH